MTRLALLFLGIPQILFILFWMTPWLGIPLATFITVLGWRWFRATSAENDAVTLHWANVAIGFATAAVCGPGNLWNQTWDWEKHNAVLNELCNTWPALFHTDTGVGVIYYLPYYLPAGLIGYLSSYDVAQIALLITTGVGLSILLQMISNLTGLAPLWNVVFLLISAPDFIFHMEPMRYPIEWWSKPPLHAISTNLLWTPQVALGTWLPALIALRAIRHGDTLSIRASWPAAALGFCWSPVSSLGLIPLLAVIGWQSLKQWKQLLLPIAVGLLLVVPTLLFFIAFPTSTLTTLTWNEKIVKTFGIVLLIEYGVWMALGLSVRSILLRWWIPMVAAATVLPSLLVIKMGRFDWEMKVTTVLGLGVGLLAMVVLFEATRSAIRQSTFPNFARLLLCWAIFAMGLITPLRQLQAIYFGFHNGVTKGSPVLQINQITPLRVSQQYLCSRPRPVVSDFFVTPKAMRDKLLTIPDER